MVAPKFAGGYPVIELTNGVTLYGTPFCPYCVAARRLLTQLDIAFEDTSVEGDNAMRHQLMEMSGQRTVPQVWVGKQHIGGYTELAALHQQGGLVPLVNAL